MNKKVFRKKLLTLLMIISIVATDFFVLGSNLLTYSSDISDETNNPNVEFSAYFKNEANERVDSLEKSIKSENLKLYAEVAVKNEGYLNEGTAIEIEDSNFILKNNILSPYIKEINGNKVVLKQITAGETIEIELDIEPIISETLDADMLSKISIVKLNGSYTGLTDSGIQYGKQVCMNFKPDETAKAELETDIITNAILAVGNTNKRVVQLLIKSRLSENQYPIQQSKINASISQLGEEADVSVVPIRTTATNGQKQLPKDSWITENGNVEITIKNDANSKNEINWKKNVYDELIITYMYPENVDASKIEIVTNSEIKLYNSENIYTETKTKDIENQELNSVIMGKTEFITQEMYKGSIYANNEQSYNTRTTIVTTNSNLADKIIINEGPDKFGRDEQEASVNTKYVSTKINKEEMLSILGQEGSIQIKSGDNVSTVNKDTEADENGNIFINYQDKVSRIEITTSKPEKEGIIEIEHTKVIAENRYTRAQLSTVKTLKAKSQITATLDETIVAQNATEQATLELKETISKAELTIENNKNTLSTAEKNEVTLGITLITEGTQYDLYKNPEISLQFPENVENVELVAPPNKQNADEFSVRIGNYDTSNRTLKINLSGEQTTYPESAFTQSYIQLNLKITVSKLATDKLDKITMTYTNENANKYYGETTDFGIIEKEIQISGQPGLIKYFNLNPNTLLKESIKQQITEENAGKIITFETLLLNNTGLNMNNIRIVGKLPTTGNIVKGQTENTLETTLTNIYAENAVIYYTENTNATTDIEDSTNGWTTDLATLTNAKLYLIKLEALKLGDSYVATVKVKMPRILEEGLNSYTEYKVIYDTENATNIEETSKDIQLATGVISNVKVNLEAKIGGQKLTNGNTVKVGEVIKYILTVENEAPESIENVTVKAMIPEGTVLVEPMTDKDEDGDIKYIYYEGYYYERSEITEKSETILLDKNTYKMEYEVRVKEDLSIEEIVNQAIVTYGNSKVESSIIKNTIQDADIRVTAKNINVEEKVVPNSLLDYTVYIENLSDQKLTNAQVKIIADNLEYVIINNKQYNIENETINIDEIEANSMKTLNIMAKVKEKDYITQPLSFVANATLNGNTYRSNEIIKEFKIANATINLSSNPQSGSSIKEGDTVRYIVDIQNNGELKELFINTKISEYLQIQEIKVDGKTHSKTNVETEEIISNIIEMMPIKFESNESKKIEIIAKVIDTPKETILITNKVSLMYTSIYEVATSNEVTHILAGSSTNVGDVKNTVSGLVWLDQNENGKKDGNESGIKDIIVKIYDVEKACYLKDSNGKVIQTLTNVEGKYTLSGVEDGLYRVTIEDNYETTTAQLQNIIVDGETKKVIASDKINIQDHIQDIDIGLKEKNKEESGNGNDGNNNGENNNTEADGKIINGYAWLDANRDGQRDTNEKGMAGVKVRLYSGATKTYLKDKNGKIIEAITDENGKYIFNNIETGKYVMLFQFNMEEYDVTKYMVEGDSKAVLKKVKIDGQEKVYAVTDIISVESDIYNINIGLSEKLIFDLELDKYISKIVVQDGKETKTYNYDNATLAKVEINRKRLQDSLVVLEYTIKVKNNGEIPGYAKNIVDYLPSGLTFGSEMNKDWYVSNGYLHTKGLENTIINPGEEKELKLILTKTMTNENTGLINNRAEIYQDYNDYATLDKDSTPNNQAQNEDDMGAVDVIIGPATGGSITIYIILVIINMILIGIAIKLMISNNVIKKLKKKGGN